MKLFCMFGLHSWVEEIWYEDPKITKEICAVCGKWRYDR